MAWIDNELSVAQGKPLRLYEFRRGTSVWRYASGDADVLSGGFTWHSTAISDDGIRLTGQTSADALAIITPASLPLVELYRGAAGAGNVGVVLRGLHRGESDAVVLWVGSVTDVVRTGADRCKLICQSLAASMDRAGLRMVWQRNCIHAVYDARCGVDKTQHRLTDIVIDDIDGQTLFCSAILPYDNSLLAGGFVEWIGLDGVTERRTIDYHAWGQLRLLDGTDGLATGMEINIYRGCDLTVATCAGVFDNIENYGGVPGLPGKSPFDGTPVF